MRMRNKLWILGVLILMITTSCYDDKGNYSYQDPNSVLPLEIDGLPKDTSFMLFSEIELTPKISGIEMRMIFSLHGTLINCMLPDSSLKEIH